MNYGIHIMSVELLIIENYLNGGEVWTELWVIKRT